jgi:saxitoxin biosynthesis operon SxtJ-like protein
MAMNEPFVSYRKVKVGSDRSFGLIFATLFAVIGLWPAISGGQRRWLSLVIAGLLLAAALFRPRLLAPLNRLWFRLGLVLHHVINPVLMALIYFGCIVPIGFILKLCGKDPLRLKRDPEAATYWIAREPPGPAPGSMAKQF